MNSPRLTLRRLTATMAVAKSPASGSAVMNRRGELIGLNFDSTYESITKDWYFDPVITRAIHVDIRYMLWVMKEVDHADNVLREMTIKYPKG